MHEPLQLAARSQTPHPPARVGDAALPLVGEVQIAVVGEVQVVQALEALAERRLEERLQLAAPGVENHQAAPVVGNEDASILVDLEAVWPAVVLRGELPVAARIDAEDAPERDVHAPEIALPVERWPFEKGVDRGALAVRIRPRRAALLAELRRQRRETPDLDFFYLLKRV